MQTAFTLYIWYIHELLSSVCLEFIYIFAHPPPLPTAIYSVGVYKNGRVDIIANDQGNRITPSYVAFTPDGERLIGDAAKNQLTLNPENTVFDAKRLIGRTWNDPMVQKDMKLWPFTIKKKNNKPHVQVNVKGEDKLFAPEEISAMVLIKMKVCLTFIISERFHSYCSLHLMSGNCRGVPRS